MTIATVATDDPVQASTMNKLIKNVNGSPGRATYVANGTFSVPEGVHQFRVTLCGGGGAGGDNGSYYASEETYTTYGGDGGRSPLASIIVTGQEPGSSFSITVGAGGAGTGGTSSFGTLLSSSGGAKGGAGPSTPGGVGSTGANGSVGGSMAGAALIHGNEMYAYGSELLPYGAGGSAGLYGPSNGRNGIVVVEW